MYEDFFLLQNNRFSRAIIYIIATILLSLIAFYYGYIRLPFLIVLK